VGLPLEEVSPRIIFGKEPHVIAYPAMLDVPRGLVQYLGRLLAIDNWQSPETVET